MTIKENIFKLKFQSPSSWNNIKGIIAEIDFSNFLTYLKEKKFKDYFVFFKDSTYGEFLKSDHILFFFVWDLEKPGILGFSTIKKISTQPKEKAWLKDDNKHSTFADSTLFDKYFHGNKVFRIEFQKIFYIPEKHQNILNYEELLLNYFKIGNITDLQRIKHFLPVYSIGNTYILKELCNQLTEKIKQYNCCITPGKKSSGEYQIQYNEYTKKRPIKDTKKTDNEYIKHLYNLYSEYTKKIMVIETDKLKAAGSQHLTEECDEKLSILYSQREKIQGKIKDYKKRNKIN